MHDKQTETQVEIAERKLQKRKENRENTQAVVVGVRNLHKSSLNQVYTALAGINRRLFDLQLLIQDAQHKQHGSITLSLNKCSSDYCLGCPHPVWLKWVDTGRNARYTAGANTEGRAKKKAGKFVAIRIKNPKPSIAQSRAVKDHSAGMYVSEAVMLLDRRSRIVKSLSLAARESRKEI